MPDPLLLDLSLPTPEENLALDEAILLETSEAARRGEQRAFLRFWESQSYFVVLGVSCRLAEDVDVEACQTAAVPVLRRASGGGTVVQGPGCVNFALTLPFETYPDLRDVHGSYRSIVERAGRALSDGDGQGSLENLSMRGSCDLAQGDRKFSGNAQKRTAHAILHHGSILYDFDLGRIPQLLREPKKQPEYRGERSHLDFVQNLDLSSSEIRERLARAWGATAPASDWQIPSLETLIDDKYGRPEWTKKF